MRDRNKMEQTIRREKIGFFIFSGREEQTIMGLHLEYHVWSMEFDRHNNATGNHPFDGFTHVKEDKSNGNNNAVDINDDDDDVELKFSSTFHVQFWHLNM